MKIYMLIPFYMGKRVKIKERDYDIVKNHLIESYSKHFGEKNEYYVDYASWERKMSDIKNLHHNYSESCYCYALEPQALVKKKNEKELRR